MKQNKTIQKSTRLSISDTKRLSNVIKQVNKRLPANYKHVTTAEFIRDAVLEKIEKEEKQNEQNKSK